MIGFRHFIVVLCIFCSMQAHAQLNNSEARGELLYTAHCSACHSTEIHWRKQKLASDWASLLVQVQRWQSIIGLVWSNAEISDVASYLNAVFYDFQIPASARKDLSGDANPLRVPSRDSESAK